MPRSLYRDAGVVGAIWVVSPAAWGSRPPAGEVRVQVGQGLLQRPRLVAELGPHAATLGERRVESIGQLGRIGRIQRCRRANRYTRSAALRSTQNRLPSAKIVTQPVPSNLWMILELGHADLLQPLDLVIAAVVGRHDVEIDAATGS